MRGQPVQDWCNSKKDRRIPVQFKGKGYGKSTTSKMNFSVRRENNGMCVNEKKF